MEIWWIVLPILGYLVGSFPTGYLIGKAKGVDIRKISSGSTGGTNVARVFGWGYGSLVAVIDGLKCFLFSAVAFWVIQDDWLVVAVVGATMIGNVFSCFLKFKGGKGVASLVGGLGPLLSWAWIPQLVIWMVLLRLTKKMSLSNLVSVLFLPLFLWLGRGSLALTILGFIAMALLYLSHRENIIRLMSGKEPSLGKRTVRWKKQEQE